MKYYKMKVIILSATSNKQKGKKMKSVTQILIIYLLAIMYSVSHAAPMYIDDITKVPPLGNGVIVMHGSGGSLPGCTSNYDRTTGDSAKEIQEGAKSISYETYKVGLFNRCYNVRIESSNDIPFVNLDAMALKYPPIQTNTHVVITATPENLQPFKTSKVKNRYGNSIILLGMGNPNSVTYFRCGVRPQDKKRIKELGFLNEKSLPPGFVMKMSFTRLGNESVEPYPRCVNYSYTLDPSLFTKPEQPPVKCNPGCMPEQ